MIRLRDKVRHKLTNKEGVVVALLDWKDNKPNLAEVRFTNEGEKHYQQENKVCRLSSLMNI